MGTTPVTSSSIFTWYPIFSPAAASSSVQVQAEVVISMVTPVRSEEISVLQGTRGTSGAGGPGSVPGSSVSGPGSSVSGPGSGVGVSGSGVAPGSGSGVAPGSGSVALPGSAAASRVAPGSVALVSGSAPGGARRWSLSALAQPKSRRARTAQANIRGRVEGRAVIGKGSDPCEARRVANPRTSAASRGKAEQPSGSVPLCLCVSVLKLAQRESRRHLSRLALACCARVSILPGQCERSPCSSSSVFSSQVRQQVPTGNRGRHGSPTPR